MVATLPRPFPAQPGIRFVDLQVPPGHRLIAGFYAGKFGYRFIRKQPTNTPPCAA